MGDKLKTEQGMNREQAGNPRQKRTSFHRECAEL
jgi:hypothetical protein